MNLSIGKVPDLEAKEATLGLCVWRDHRLATSMETNVLWERARFATFSYAFIDKFLCTIC